MSRRGKDLIIAAREARAHAHGQPGFTRESTVRAPESVDPRAIRVALGLSQTAFAETFGFAVATLRDWEQGRRRPDGSARILLAVIEREPEAVRRALQDVHESAGAAPAGGRHGGDGGHGIGNRGGPDGRP